MTNHSLLFKILTYVFLPPDVKLMSPVCMAIISRRSLRIPSRGSSLAREAADLSTDRPIVTVGAPLERDVTGCEI